MRARLSITDKDGKQVISGDYEIASPIISRGPCMIFGAGCDEPRAKGISSWKAGLLTFGIGSAEGGPKRILRRRWTTCGEPR